MKKKWITFKKFKPNWNILEMKFCQCFINLRWDNETVQKAALSTTIHYLVHLPKFNT